ncbi:uncharacterized protein PHA67_014652 isoform 2-T2 [Liasis olivaceus]
MPREKDSVRLRVSRKLQLEQLLFLLGSPKDHLRLRGPSPRRKKANGKGGCFAHNTQASLKMHSPHFSSVWLNLLLAVKNSFQSTLKTGRALMVPALLAKYNAIKR